MVMPSVVDKYGLAVDPIDLENLADPQVRDHTIKRMRLMVMRRMHELGYSLRSIALFFGVHESTVCRALQLLKRLSAEGDE
jgi:hypothetical protein